MDLGSFFLSLAILLMTVWIKATHTLDNVMQQAETLFTYAISKQKCLCAFVNVFLSTKNHDLKCFSLYCSSLLFALFFDPENTFWLSIVSIIVMVCGWYVGFFIIWMRENVEYFTKSYKKITRKSKDKYMCSLAHISKWTTYVTYMYQLRT